MNLDAKIAFGQAFKGRQEVWQSFFLNTFGLHGIQEALDDSCEFVLYVFFFLLANQSYPHMDT